MARLAGVSVDYYTRIEQGRHPNVSDSVLAAISRALLLDGIEHDYLFELAQPKAARSARLQASEAPQVRCHTLSMLDALDDVAPTLVLNHREDVLAANRLARALFVDFRRPPHKNRNLASFVLLDPAATDLFMDWERVAEMHVASLRLASAHHPDDSRLTDLIKELSIAAPMFNTWWASHRVDHCTHGVQVFNHPVVGELSLSFENLSFLSEPDQNLTVYSAERGSNSHDSLRLLGSWIAPQLMEPPRS